MNNRRLIFCGDIHGDFNLLVHNLAEKELNHSDIIVLGDFGVGFEKRGYWENLYNRNKKKLEALDIYIYAMRGNHDDPSYFINPVNFERLIFLEDHKIYDHYGCKIYTIGGANSVDITDRLEYNEFLKSKGKKERVWWEGEDIVRVPLDIIKSKNPDIIISHEAPICFPPITTRLSMTPMEQYSKILDSRNYLASVLNFVKPSYWFYGHYHQSYVGSYLLEDKAVVNYRCLSIQELYEFREQKESN